VIERGDAELRAWLQPLLDGAAVSFDAPPIAVEGSALVLNAYLFDVDRPAAVASSRTPPIELTLGYLVSAWGSDSVAAHALLGRVLLAALAQAQYAVELGAAAAAAWGALATRRPAFVLRVRVAQDRGILLAPPVRAPARVESMATGTLRGRVQAPDGQPIVDAVVEIAALSRSSPTGSDGRFVFGGIPPALPLTVHVRAKGREIDVERAPGSLDEELIVTFSV
jgi:hypothetical protein